MLKKIVFLDTARTEAFLQCELIGAQVTDIAVLVVAADIGVRKPQTIESISRERRRSYDCCHQ